MNIFADLVAALQEEERQKKEEELRQQAIDASKNAQQDYQTSQEMSKLKNTLGNLDFSQMETSSTGGGTALDNRSSMPEAQALGADLSKRRALMDTTPSKIFQKYGLTDKYSQVPEAKSAMQAVQSDYARQQGNEFASKISDENDKAVFEYLNNTDPEIAQQFANKLLTKKSAGGGVNGWSERSKDWDNIASMPEGEEKEQAKIAYLYKWAPSAGYQASPEGVQQAVKKSVAVESATAPIKTRVAAATAAATGDVKADTPEFISEKQKEWSAEVKPYAEAVQNYQFAKSGAQGAINDVALIKALEKVRESDSAVMFGDAEIWRKAGNFWDKAIEGGIVDAIKSGAQKRLPESYRKELTKLLENAMSVASQRMRQKRDSYAEVAKQDYGWNEDRINRVYKVPSAQSSDDRTAANPKIKSLREKYGY